MKLRSCCNFDIQKKLDGDSISEGMICEKVLHIYADLLKETPSKSAEGESGFTFKASKVWLKNLNNKVESIALLDMERRPVQIRKQPKIMLENSVIL